MALIMRKQQKLYQSGLKSIAKGGGLILGGSFSRIVLTFLLNIIIMRYISQSEFGFFSICIVVVNIMALLSGLGFQRALPGYISCQIGMKEFCKAWSSTVASFRILSLLSTSIP
jgi:O-antigen/teichoic acid export membrane protein